MADWVAGARRHARAPSTGQRRPHPLARIAPTGHGDVPTSQDLVGIILVIIGVATHRDAHPAAGGWPNDPGGDWPTRPGRTRHNLAVMEDTRSNTVLTLLQEQHPVIPDGACAMTALIELPPGDPGTPPHRHSGPVFGYMLEGEMIFELEGEPERTIRVGEPFWEPGGDVIHYQAANNLPDKTSRFVVVMMCVPGEPMLTLVSDEELRQRAARRQSAQQPAADLDPAS
jgi:quercetin dioxygenase-like cupin family protein